MFEEIVKKYLDEANRVHFNDPTEIGNFLESVQKDFSAALESIFGQARKPERSEQKPSSHEHQSRLTPTDSKGEKQEPKIPGNDSSCRIEKRKLVYGCPYNIFGDTREKAEKFIMGILDEQIKEILNECGIIETVVVFKFYPNTESIGDFVFEWDNENKRFVCKVEINGKMEPKFYYDTTTDPHSFVCVDGDQPEGDCMDPSAGDEEKPEETAKPDDMCYCNKDSKSILDNEEPCDPFDDVVNNDPRGVAEFINKNISDTQVGMLEEAKKNLYDKMRVLFIGQLKSKQYHPIYGDEIDTTNRLRAVKGISVPFGDIVTEELTNEYGLSIKVVLTSVAKDLGFADVTFNTDSSNLTKMNCFFENQMHFEEDVPENQVLDDKTVSAETSDIQDDDKKDIQKIAKTGTRNKQKKVLK